MDPSLRHIPADEPTRLLVQRSAELGLWVWRCDQGELTLQTPDPLPDGWERPEPALTEALRANLDLIRQNDAPTPLADERCAAWVGAPLDLSAGFVLVARGEPDQPALSRQALATATRTLAWMLEDLYEAEQGRLAVDDLTEQLGQCYENITLLYDIGRSMRTVDTPRIVAQNICDQIRMTQGFGWSAVCVERDELEISGMDQTCLFTGELPCESHRFIGQANKLLGDWGTLGADHKLLQVGDHPLADTVGCETIIEPITRDGRVIGLVLAGGKTGPESEATSSDRQLLDAVAGFLGALHDNTARLIEQKNMFIGSLKAVSAALDAKDRYTQGHSERVAWLGAQLAEAIGLSDEQVERIRIAGLVHDVGKIGVPEVVLCKTGRLTDDEFEQIKKHPRIGYNILKDIPGMQDVLDGVLYHHEKWDGRGYPTKLAGENIPIYGRILAVADTFDAMSSTRSYRQAMPREKVLQEIRDCAGTQFDPALTGPFVQLDFTEYDAMVDRHQGESTQSTGATKELAA